MIKGRNGGAGLVYKLKRGIFVISSPNDSADLENGGCRMEQPCFLPYVIAILLAQN